MPPADAGAGAAPVALRPVPAVPPKLVGSRIFYRNATTTAIEKHAGQPGFEDRQWQFAHSPRTLSWKRTKTGSDAVTVSLPKVNSPCRPVNNCEQAPPEPPRAGQSSTLLQRAVPGNMRRKQYVVRDHTAGGSGRGGREPAGHRLGDERPERGRGGPTTGVVPAAADEVSALTAAQFAAHAQMYQAVSAQAAAIHEMFVNTLATSSGSYAATEVANAAARWLADRRGTGRTTVTDVGFHSNRPAVDDLGGRLHGPRQRPGTAGIVVNSNTAVRVRHLRIVLDARSAALMERGIHPQSVRLGGCASA